MADLTLAAWVFSIVGFLIASYSIVANDAIQTLGTFLSSNAKRPWWILWLFAAGIMVGALMFQLFYGGGDIDAALAAVDAGADRRWAAAE